MTPQTLESLPAEIAQQIYAYLDQKTQWALALTSKTCNSVVQVHLFHTIQLHILDGNKLKSDIDGWERVLKRTAAYSKVSRLVIKDHNSNPPIDLTSSWPGSGKACDVIEAADNLTSWDEDDILEGESSGVAKPKAIHDDDWLLLANFVRTLFRLHTMVYKCWHKIPACLATAVQQNHPKCSVDIAKINDCGLTVMGRSVNNLTPVIMPQVRSVSLRMAIFEPEYDLGQTCLRKILSRAPRMTDLGVSWFFQGAYSVGPYLETLRVRQKAYLSENAHRIVPSTSVKTLRLKIKGDIYPEHLEFFSYHIDLSSIRVLKIDGDMSDEALDWAVDNCTFSSLECLVMRSCTLNGNRELEYLHGHCTRMARFLRSLPPLRYLRICDALDHNMVATILQCHGPSLHRLWIENVSCYTRFVFTCPVIAQIQKTCRMLKDLKIPVSRSQGSLDEVKVYQELGAIKRLRTLWLVLEIDELPGRVYDPPKPSTHFDEFDLQPLILEPRPHLQRSKLMRGHMRSALINSAVDEMLARAIFDTISTSRAKNAVSLESLGILPTCEDYYERRLPVGGYGPIVENMSRWWLLTRDPRDTHCQEVHAKESGQEWRLARSERRGNMVISESMVSVFGRIWPGSREEKFWWRDNWYSLPLASAT